MTPSDIDDGNPGAALARFAATVTIDAIPAPVLRRAEDLMLDWFGCALAGKGRGRSRASRASFRAWGRPRA